mmetsp:Transcript_71719/g.171321  ORF Transcript_71719/g.171321 Transcript_71719/m.171321 type:complete len:380 (-) Transcript_71719:1269-2408(-)
MLRHAVFAACSSRRAQAHVQLRPRTLRLTSHPEKPLARPRVAGRKAQGSVPHGRGGPARSTGCRSGPLRPRAIQRRFALAGAVRGLLRSSDVTGLAAVVRHLDYGAMAVLLAAALAATSPVAPLAPPAVFTVNLMAGVQIAWLHGGEIRFARLSPVFRCCADSTTPLSLTTTASTRATCPLSPVVQFTIYRRLLLAVSRRHLQLQRQAVQCIGIEGSNRAGITRLDDLEGCTGTRVALARGKVGDEAIPLSNPKAMAAAMRPFAPVVQLAICVLDAWLQVAAHLILVSRTGSGLAAATRLDFEIATSRLIAAGTCCRAGGPRAPGSPLTIHATTSARLCVARKGLLHVLRLTFFSTIPRSFHDTPGSSFRSTTALARAI